MRPQFLFISASHTWPAQSQPVFRGCHFHPCFGWCFAFRQGWAQISFHQLLRTSFRIGDWWDLELGAWIFLIPFLPNRPNQAKVTLVSTNTLTEIRTIRLGKAASLRAAGLNPYPSRSKRTHHAKAILDDFAKHEGQQSTVAGRLMSWRKQGALAFGHVQDQTGRIQLFLRRTLVQPMDVAAGTMGYAELNLLDLGDS